jgi:5-deoxy-glucuronate isomerase
VADGPAGPGMGYLQASNVLAEVRSGDVVTIPRGWHGPAMAVPGYDMYYLNVMAGPGRREWLICDDPAHSWIREKWQHQQADPRLPYGRPN